MALEGILATKRIEVAGRKALAPIDRLTQAAEPSDRDFLAALRARRPAFICEIKPASPSEGPLRPVTAMDEPIASYARHADAVSVLTDETYFGGSRALLTRVRAAISQPVLCKDFVVDPYQVVEARLAGADAILLMLSVLDDPTYQAAAALATDLRMGVLTEVHSAEELRRASALGAAVIGINNRNLATLTVDLDTTRALAALAPPAAVVIAESGIRGRDDVLRLGGLVDGFLVGTLLMRAPAVDRTLRGLVYGSTKICGLTQAEDTIDAARYGATHGGLIFVAESPRAVTMAAARTIRQAAQLAFVGVFVNEEPDRIAAVADELDLAAVQLHGEETPEAVTRLRFLMPNREIWKAVPIGGAIPEAVATATHERRGNRWGADRVVLDRLDPARRGGTGQPFDWELLHTVPGPRSLILSGGVGPENIERALTTGLDFFDVNSAVETTPGRKSAEAVERFFALRRRRPVTPTDGVRSHR